MYGVRPVRVVCPAMKLRAVVFPVLLALGATGCGGGSDDPERPISESEVLVALQVEEDAASGNWADPASGCKAVTIIRSSDEIATYEEAGDTIATNPKRTVGVKVFAGPSTPIDACADTFNSRLAGLE
jgi:hypothetical protein